MLTGVPIGRTAPRTSAATNPIPTGRRIPGRCLTSLAPLPDDLLGHDGALVGSAAGRHAGPVRRIGRERHVGSGDPLYGLSTPPRPPAWRLPVRVPVAASSTWSSPATRRTGPGGHRRPV